MSLRQWIHRLSAPRASGPADWSDFWYTEYGGATTASGVDVTSESAMRTSAVWSCVRVQCDSVSTIPLHLYRRTRNGDRKRATEHPLYDVLHDTPNPFQTALEFREMLQAHVALRGNGYALIVSGSRGYVTSLVPVHPDRMRIERTQDGALRYVYVDASGQTRRFLPDEVLHLRGLSFDGITGVTPITYARETIGRQVAMERSNARFHRNDGAPRVAVTHPQKLSPDAHKRFVASWNATYAGTENAHKAAILEEGMTVVPIGLKPEDAQFVESWEGGITDICRWFGVHPRMIGAKSGDSQTYANVEQAQIEHVTNTVRPLCVRWEQALSRALLTEADREWYYPEFAIAGLLRADHIARSTYYEKAFGRWMTANEIRQLENLPKIDGGDELQEATPAQIPGAPVDVEQDDDGENEQ